MNSCLIGKAERLYTLGRKVVLYVPGLLKWICDLETATRKDLV